MSFEISSVGDFESFDYLCKAILRSFCSHPCIQFQAQKVRWETQGVIFFVTNVTKVGTSRTYVKQKYLPHPHSVKSFKQVQRVELVLLILQSNQKWGTIKFEVNFRPLIQLNSRGLLISFDGGQPLLSRIWIIVYLDAAASNWGQKWFLFTYATFCAICDATPTLYFVFM